MNPSCYRIRIRGHPGPAWSAWFDSLTVARADDGTTELVGPLIDQAALYGVLTRLRDLDGTVWYVPNGEILRVGNKSQNWSRAVVDVGVGYDEDLTRAKRVLGEVAEDLWEDDDYRSVIIEAPEVTGVEALTPDAITLRVLVKTQPMEQWQVARELRQRIKARFDHEGIEIPFPQRVLHVIGDGGAEPPRRDAPDPRET